ncbi:MAG: hypothetical protein L3K07_02270, partial [Thermoplasmata archaeon]|nr:hypothetical protein [Thermoplasmata archaeon]
NWNSLLGYLELGYPVTMGLGWNDLHAVVAFGEQTLSNGTFELDISDPNVPLQTTHGFYDPNANHFTYGAAGLHWNGFDVTGTAIPETLQPSWYYPFGDPWNIWGDDYFTSGSGGFTFIAAVVPVTVAAGTGTDSFTAPGNSQSFVNNIPGSSGVEEGSVQIYAIPQASVGPGLVITDPSIGSSVFQVLTTSNSTGSLVLNGFSVQVDSAGPHTFSIRPTASGFGLDVGNVSNDTAWANLSFYHLTNQGHAELNASLLDFSNGTLANFTVNDWSALSSTTTPSVTVTVTGPAGGSGRVYHLVNGQTGLIPSVTPPIGHTPGGGGNSTSVPFYRSMNFWTGVGTGALALAVVAIAALTVGRRRVGPGSRTAPANPPASPPPPT